MISNLILLRVLFVFFIMFFTVIVRAQVQWTQHPGNPVLGYGLPGTWDAAGLLAPKVIQVGDTLKMWYLSAQQCSPTGAEIGYAWSLDGITWNRYANNPVFAAQPGSWDAGGVTLGSVVADGDTLRMWYEGLTNNIKSAGIGYAISTDGINWTRYPDPAIIPADIEWVTDVLWPDCVIKDNGVFKMWFTGGSGHPPGDPADAYIGYATSSDGINWNIHNDPVLSPGLSGFDNNTAAFSSVLKNEDSSYEMWYTGNSSGIGYTTSPDGIIWTKFTGNPIFLPPTSISGWAAFAFFFPNVLRDDTGYRMWFAGIDPSPGKCIRIGYATAPVSQTIYNLEVFANNLFSSGFEFDSQGKLWAAEGRTGLNNDRVSIITTDGTIYPFITGLPSTLTNNRPDGVIDVNFDTDGKLLVVRAGGIDSFGSSILVFDTTGFIPGNPKSISDTAAVYKIRDFALSQGSVTPFLRWVTNGPDNDLFITERGLKGIIRRERSTGNLSVFKKWEDFHAQGIVFTGQKFFVSSMTDPPVAAGEDKIYEVDLSGNYTEYHSNLTAVMALTIDPKDNRIVFLQLGLPSNGDWLPNTGGIFKINNGIIDTIVYPINYPFALSYNPKGELFVSTLTGTIYKVTSTLTDVETIEGEGSPTAFHLSQNYPNPFNPSTKIRFTLDSRQFISLRIYDVLGREVAKLINEEKPAGIYEVTFNANSLSSGVYFYKIEGTSNGSQSVSFVEAKKMILLR